MSVWDVPEERIDELGRQVGALAFVTHCYHRPRRLPDWLYNLFAMVHGGSRAEVMTKAAEIAAIIGSDCRAHDDAFFHPHPQEDRPQNRCLRDGGTMVVSRRTGLSAVRLVNR